MNCKPTDAGVVAPDVPDPVAVPPRKATEEVQEAAPADAAALDAISYCLEADLRSAVETVLTIPKTLHNSSPAGPTEALPTAVSVSPSQPTLEAISLMLDLAQDGDGSQALALLAGLTGAGGNETQSAMALIDRLKRMQASILDTQ